MYDTIINELNETYTPSISSDISTKSFNNNNNIYDTIISDGGFSDDDNDPETIQSNQLEKNLKGLAGYEALENEIEKELNDAQFRTKRTKSPVRSTVIIGDSMVRHISGKRLSEHLENQRVFVKSYGGMKVGDTKYHAFPNMKYNPNHIIVHVGTNEIRTRKTATKIANDIMKVCMGLKSDDNDVSVSGLVLRGDEEENEKVKEVNCILKRLCREHNYYFIDHSNIPPTRKFLVEGLHLEKAGNNIFFNNIFDFLRY